MDRRIAVTLAVGGCVTGACQYDPPSDRQPVDAALDAVVVDARPGPFVLTFGGEQEARFHVQAAPDGGAAFAGWNLGARFQVGSVRIDRPGLVVGRLDPDGVVRWVRGLEAPTGGANTRVAIAPNGDVVVAGAFAGTMSLGSSTLVAAGLYDVFVLVMDAATGEVVGAVGVRGEDDEGDFLHDIALDEQGNVYVAATFTGPFSVCGVSHNASGVSVGYLARLDARGLFCRWERVAIGSPSSSNAAIGVAFNQRVFFGVNSYGDLALGGGLLSDRGGSDIVLASFEPATGAHVASTRLGGAGLERAARIDSAGSAVFLSGELIGPMSLGGGGAVVSPNQGDHFVARFDAASLAHVWARAMGLDRRVSGYFSLDGGELALTGNINASVSVGGEVLVPAGGRDALFARYSVVDGSHMESAVMGGLGNDDGIAQSGTPHGRMWSGWFSGALTVSAQTFPAIGVSDVFVVRQ